MQEKEEEKEDSFFQKQNYSNSPGNIAQKSDTTIDGIRFWSTFDSGNLKSVAQITENFFQLKLGKDSEEISNEGRSNWFYFKIKCQKQSALNLQIVNIESPIFLAQYLEGQKEILYKEKGKKQWQHKSLKNIKQKPRILEIEFELEFKENTEYSICFSYPWSYQHNQKWLKNIEQQFSQNPNIYFKNELLCYSLDKNEVNLITITSKKGILKNQKEEVYEHPFLFPQENYSLENKDKQKQILQDSRPNKFSDKKYIFITARVHSGETPANYILRGFINFLLENSVDSQSFLDEFVLCFIPMLNPDGVIRGHYRLDSRGIDLNREYNSCVEKRDIYPANFAVLKVAQNIDSQQKLFAYFDLHAHVNYSGGFMFGNTHHSNATKSEIRLIPKMMQIMVPCFKYSLCLYNINNSIKNPPDQIRNIHPDKRGLQYTVSKEIRKKFEEEQKQKRIKFMENLKFQQEQVLQSQQQGSTYNESMKLLQSQDFKSEQIHTQTIESLQGVAKTDVYLTTSIHLSYTVEANYAYHYCLDDKGNKKLNKMRVGDFEQIGTGLANSLLEIIEKKQNSLFQQQGSKYQNIQQLRNEIYYDLTNKK